MQPCSGGGVARQYDQYLVILGLPPVPTDRQVSWLTDPRSGQAFPGLPSGSTGRQCRHAACPQLPDHSDEIAQYSQLFPFYPTALRKPQLWAPDCNDLF